MIWKNVRHRLKLAWTNVRVAAAWDVLLEKGVTIKYAASLSFGAHCTLQSGAYLYGSRRGKRVILGDGVVVAAGAMLLGEGGCTIGDHTHLGPRVVVTTQYGDRRGEMVTDAPTVKTAAITIGRGCWIGSGSVVMPGAALGDRCVVAPGSVVYGRWPNEATLAGNPARRVKTPDRPARADGRTGGSTEPAIGDGVAEGVARLVAS